MGNVTDAFWLSSKADLALAAHDLLRCLNLALGTEAKTRHDNHCAAPWTRLRWRPLARPGQMSPKSSLPRPSERSEPPKPRPTTPSSGWPGRRPGRTESWNRPMAWSFDWSRCWTNVRCSGVSADHQSVTVVDSHGKLAEAAEIIGWDDLYPIAELALPAQR